MVKWGVLVIVLLGLQSCESESYIPKPVGYSRMDFETHSYINSPESDCPFVFEYGAGSKLTKVNAAEGYRCWFNIEYPDQKAKVLVSYLDIEAKNISSYTADARKMAMEHLAKADDFEENTIIDTAANVYGVIYNFEGNMASNFQFYLTDSLNHFVRGALFFEVTPNSDSLAPAELYIEEELMHLIQTFKWRKE